MPPDPAHEATEEKIKELEKRIKEQYEAAMKTAESKWKEYMRSFDTEDANQKKRLQNGEITKEEYQNWRTRHLAMGKRWEDMKNTLAQDYHNANVIATKMARGEMADVFATNANFATYLIEHGGKIDTGFTLYNHETAEELIKHEWTINPETGKNSFLPPPKPGGKRARELEKLRGTNPDVLWNAQNIQSAMMQGILTGESLPDIAKRLAGVAKMNETQAKRTARTMFTNMENFGRMKAADRAASLGVEIMDEWSAILDGVTRHSHRHLHGYRKPHDMDEPFPNGCRWPGDPSGPPQEIWNCRCTLLNWVSGFEGDTVKKSPGMGDMSFEEWLDAHADSERHGSGSQDDTFTPFDTDKVNVLTKTDYSKETLDEMTSLSGISELNLDDIDSVRIGKKTVTISGDGIDIRVQIDKEENALILDYMELANKGQGKGAKVLDSMVEAARAQGFEKIVLDASGSYGSSQNGYYTWPRLGFDASLTSAQKEKAKNAGFVAEKISDLMKTEEGRKYWKENGTSIQEAVFDLRENSESMLTLEEYLKKKRK